MPPPTVAFRPVAAGDEGFLAEVYRQARWEELSVTGWPEQQKCAFLAQQFQFQTRDWARVYPDAQRDLILVNSEPAGRLYLHRDAVQRDLRVVDIALLPPFRNRGIGTGIFQRLFAEADEQGWKVSIHVEQQNPARHLYFRLGFAPVRDAGVYRLMERPPLAAVASRDS